MVKKGLLTKKHFLCVLGIYFQYCHKKNIFFCGFPLSMCINVRNALNIKHFKRLFLMSPKYSQLQLYLCLSHLTVYYKLSQTERFFKSQVFTLYVIQAQCRNWYRLKPGFLGQFIVSFRIYILNVFFLKKFTYVYGRMNSALLAEKGFENSQENTQGNLKDKGRKF